MSIHDPTHIHHILHLTPEYSKVPDDTFDIYTLSYRFLPPEQDISLFVKTGEGKDGDFFRVEDDVTEENYKKMKYVHKKGYHPGFALYEKQTHIGTVSKRKLKKLISVCEQMPPPSFPVVHGGDSQNDNPNCLKWMQNVLHKLDTEGIVQFNSDAFVPASFSPLVIPPSIVSSP